MPADLAAAIACLGLRTRRVDDADQRQERQVRHQRQQVGIRVERGRVEVLLGRGHDPQALLTEPFVLGLEGVPDLVQRDGRTIGAVGVLGACQQLVGCALDEGTDDVLAGSVRHVVEGGHELVRGVEGQLGDARIPLAGQHRVGAALGGEHDQGALGRVTHQDTVLDHRVRAECERQHVLLQGHVGLPGRVRDLAHRRVALARDGVAPADDGHLDGGHLVERQGAGLVGVDG